MLVELPNAPDARGVAQHPLQNIRGAERQQVRKNGVENRFVHDTDVSSGYPHLFSCHFR
jgi:hypothetical protein